MSANSKQMDPSVESIERPALFRLTRETVRRLCREEERRDLEGVSTRTDDGRVPSKYRSEKVASLEKMRSAT